MGGRVGGAGVEAADKTTDVGVGGLAVLVNTFRAIDCWLTRAAEEGGPEVRLMGHCPDNVIWCVAAGEESES